jgi:two-component system, sensor histidine kinase and response regulator
MTAEWRKLDMDAPQRGILVVDDEPSMRELLVDVLLSSGFEVRSATNGEQVLEAVAAGPPRLILMDVNMPGMDGIEAVRKLKARDEYFDIPVIFVSGTAKKDEMIEALSLGAVDFIHKPYRNCDLLERICKYLH